MSSRMRSNGSASARASPAGPSRSTNTSWSASSAASNSSTFIASSSTTRMRKLSPLRRGRTTGAGLQGRRRFGFHTDDDHRDAATRIALLDVSEELLAAAVRESHVEYHADRGIAPNRLLRLGDAADHFRPQVARSGHGDDQVGIVAFVLDDKDPLAGDGFGMDVGEHDAEGRAISLLALERDPAAHLLHEPFGQRETKPGPGRVDASFVKALEHTENAVVGVVRDTDARVGDTDFQVGAARSRRQPDRSTARGELDRVREQVEEDLPDPRLIDKEARSVRSLHLELHVLGLRGASGPGADRFQEDVERHHFRPQLELASLDLREIEHIV